MLEYLKVKNLAIVENAEVHFAPGLNIVTGETGSGKSVLIGALSLILGERADHGAIRTGTPEMSVEAGFSITDPLPVDTVLADPDSRHARRGSYSSAASSPRTAPAAAGSTTPRRPSRRSAASART